MKPPTYADQGQIAEFFRWFEGERIRTNTPKTKLAEAIGREGTTYINGILQGRRLPTPSTLRVLCGVMGIPWFMAFTNVGYYRSILLVLEGLVDIGKRWCVEDAVHPSPESPTFPFTGVLKIRGTIVTEALNDSRYADRYVVGKYADHIGDGSIPCFVPKPLAIAIFVACAGFARRGDVYKDGLSGYAADVLAAAGDLVNIADPADDAKKPSGLLGDADDALKNKSMPFENRRVVAAEYMTKWADQLSQRYTEYARLAVFWQWGEAGSTQSNVSVFTVMPQIKTATVPDLAQFQGNG